MMKAPFAALLLFLLAVRPAPTLAAPREGPQDPRRGGLEDSRQEKNVALAYRLEYQIRGGAISRLLLFFPLRVFYTAAAAVDFTAQAQADGVT